GFAAGSGGRARGTAAGSERPRPTYSGGSRPSLNGSTPLRRAKASALMINPQPVVLEGADIRLEPLTENHHDALVGAASDGRLWEFWFTAVPTPDGMRAYLADALNGQREGHMLAWIVRDLTSGAIVGATRYHDI